MEFILYFLAIGVTVVFMLLKLDMQQSSRLNKVLKESKNVQPLFLQRATEQKLRYLNTKLYGNISLGLNAMPTGRINMDEGARQLIASQLNTVVSNYNAGRITLKDYNIKLNGVLAMIDEVKGMNFERI